MFQTSDNQEVAKIVVHILRIVAKKIEDNPELLTNAELSLLEMPVVKRKVEILIDFSVFDVFAKGGEPALREKLEPLEIKTLKNIIAKNSFDPAQLAKKWRSKDKLVDFIIDRVTTRSRKGQVFMEVS